MSDLLSRYAECLFWFGRYTERTACLARILEVQTSFNRGRTDSADWSWILTLYDDHALFRERYDEANAANVTVFYVNDRSNPGSIVSSIIAARENARTLRAVISTDLWQQVNTFYNRFRVLPPAALSAARLSATCHLVKEECYAQLGVAEATLYRDAGWRFFQMGVFVERADQMSRLLDVRFAQARSRPEIDTRGDFPFWSLLLRSAAAHQAFLRSSGGARDPEHVARFLILDPALPRSLNYCTSELDRISNELRMGFRLRRASRLLERIELIRELLTQASYDAELIGRLHDFNDGMQSQLIHLTNEIARAFFGAEAPSSDDSMRQTQVAGVGGASSSQRQEQSQSST